MIIVTRAATQKHVAGMVWTVPLILLPSRLMVHWWSWCCCSPRSFLVTLRVSCALWDCCCTPIWDLSWMRIKDLWCTHTIEMRKTKCKTILPLWSNVENESWRGRLLGMFLAQKWTFCSFYFYSIYAFSRRFYPKWLRLNIICQYVCSLGIEPTTFCTANAMLYHWATGKVYLVYLRYCLYKLTCFGCLLGLDQRFTWRLTINSVLSTRMNASPVQTRLQAS